MSSENKLKKLTTEYTESHGGKKIFVRKTLCNSVSSVVILYSLFLLISCSAQKLPVKEISIEREGQVLAVVKAEIASNAEDRSKGLMFRKSLKDGNGMLFIFERDQVLSFWMRNTTIPLSIAYITYDGKIIDIKDMYPLNETSVVSSRMARYALEVPQGWFTRAGIREGDIVIINL